MHFDPAFSPGDGRATASRRGHEDARDPGGTGPRAVAAALEEASARLASRLLAMNKSYRQGQILKLIRSRRLHTQEELAARSARSALPPRR